MVLGRMRSIFLFVIVSSFFFPTPSAEAASMKLLTPQVGWALAGPGLMWTTNGGADWTNITPPVPAGEHVSTVFFLNTQDGWVLLTGANTGSEAPRFDVATTVNSGATWSVTTFEVPGLELAGYNLSGGGHLFFLDTLNGWANLDVPGMSRPALLLETHDGGRNWSRPPSNPNVAGELRFINSKVGWITGGPTGDELYGTRNAGESWKQISLGATVNGSPVTCSANAPPHFTDGTQGYMAASCMGGAIALFGTINAGKTWDQQRVLTGIGGTATVATSVADAALIAGVVNDHTLTLLRDTPQGLTKVSSEIGVPRSGVVDLSFADTMNGWALLVHHGAMHELMATADGGNTWADITPHPPQKPFPPAKPPKWRSIDPLTGRPTGDGKPQAAVPSGAPSSQLFLSSSESMPTLTAQAPGGGGGGAVHTSVHIGFDRCFDKSKVNQQQFLNKLQAWWTYSPYYDYGLYIGGVNTKCLLPTDSSTVNSLASQGWGIIPLWVGLQAPCSTGFYTFRDDPAGAAADGKQEADQSTTGTIAKASSLGLSKAVIYYDLEPYDTTNDPNCGPSVTAFIGAWVNEMKKHGYSAGVYVNPYGAEAQISQASPQPDEIWVSKWDSRATTWGLGALDDSQWTSDQRAHQFVAPHDEIWGNTTIQVDSDIEDVPVAGSNGTKTGTFVVNSFLTGEYFPIGINDVVSNGTGVAFTYNEGQVAGLYNLDTGYGFLWDPNDGFLYAPITYGSLTYGEDVNNVGQVVGEWNDYASGWYLAYHGLLFQNGSYASYDYPGTTGGTHFLGINDDAEMVGYYEDMNDNDHAFLLPSLGDLPQDITIQGAISIVAQGINGAGQIVGDYEDSRGNVHGFFYDPHSGSDPVTIDCSRSTTTVLTGINNNQQIAGFCNNYSTMFVYDYVHKNFTNIPFTGTDLLLYGINDGDQGVGYAWDPSNSVWVPFTVTETH